MYKITFLFLILSFSGITQNTYKFDHVLEYDYQNSKNESTVIQYIMTNAQETYFAHVTPIDSGYYKMVMMDREGGTYIKIKVKENDFFKAETFLVECNLVWPFSYPYKYRTREYIFRKEKDSMIESKPFAFYTFLHKNPKKANRKKLAELKYVIEPKTDYHEPIFLHSTAFEEWRKEKTFPKGIIKYRYFVNHSGDTTGIYKLKKIHKLIKFISHPEDCEPITLKGINIKTMNPAGYN